MTRKIRERIPKGTELTPEWLLVKILVMKPAERDYERAKRLPGVFVDAILECELMKVKGREAEILARRFGLYGRKPETLQELGKLFGVSRERVRSIANEAIWKLQVYQAMGDDRYGPGTAARDIYRWEEGQS